MFRLAGKRHRFLTTKKAFVPSNEETKAKTSAVPLSLALACSLPASAQSALCEFRLSGNGEETRFRLNPTDLSGNTRGPVTSLRSALPRSDRQLSEACTKELFPCHRICLFAVEHKIQESHSKINCDFYQMAEFEFRKIWRSSLRCLENGPEADALPARQRDSVFTSSASSSCRGARRRPSRSGGRQPCGAGPGNGSCGRRWGSSR